MRDSSRERYNSETAVEKDSKGETAAEKGTETAAEKVRQQQRTIQMRDSSRESQHPKHVNKMKRTYIGTCTGRSSSCIIVTQKSWQLFDRMPYRSPLPTYNHFSVPLVTAK